MAALVAALALAPSLYASPLEVGHPAYDLLRRLSALRAIERPFLGSQPMATDEVVRLLRAANADSARLTAYDRRELARHLRDLDPELRRADTRLNYRDSTRWLSGRAALRMGATYRDSLPRADASAGSFLEAGLEGGFGRSLTFVSQAGVGGEWSSHPRYLMNYDPSRGLPYNTREGRVDPSDRDERMTFDAYRTVISWRADHWGADAGNDWNSWGPGVWQHASLGPRPWFWVQDSLPASDSAGFAGSILPGGYRRGYRSPGEGPPLNQIRIDFTWPFLRYTKVVAERTGLTSRGRAFLTAHRLEARLGPRLAVGAFEMVSYAGRSLEPMYTIPLVPLKIAEHLVGDQDNIALGVDVDWNALRGLRLYSELFLDDLLGPLELLGDYWGNKFAFTAGAEYFDLLPASALQAEYARVEPWLFSHHVYDSQLQHFGALLGSGIPSNSHAFRLRFLKALVPGVEAGLEYGFLQRGTRAPGSTPVDVHSDSLHGRTKEFLAGGAETRHALRAEAGWRPGRFAEVRAAAGLLRVTRWRGDAGADLATPTLEAEAILRY